MHYLVALCHAVGSFCRLLFDPSAGCLFILLWAAFRSFCRLPFDPSAGCLSILLLQAARGHQCDSCGSLLNLRGPIFHPHDHKAHLRSLQINATLNIIVSHLLVSMQDARGDQCDSCGNLLNPTDLINPKCKLTGTTPVLRTTKHIFLDLPKLSPQLQAYITDTSNKGGWSNNCVQVMPCSAKCPALKLALRQSCHVLCLG